MSNDSLTELAKVIAEGLPGPNGGLRSCIDALFGERYQKRRHSPTAVRDAYALADGEEGVPYAGSINPHNPPSGPYGGTSVVWFPSRDVGPLLDFGIGTRGLAPDEGILTRPGHKRRITALRRYVARLGVDTVSAARGLGRIVLHPHGTPLPLELLDLAAGVPPKKRVGRALRHDVPPALAREEPTAAAAGSIDRAGLTSPCEAA